MDVGGLGDKAKQAEENLLGDAAKRLGKSPEELRADVHLAKELGLDLLRLNGHLTRHELYEAADVDGASAWQRFRRITFPLVAPTTFFLLIVQTIWGMQAFDQIFVMTNGGPPGPGGATTTVVYYLWQQGFRFFRMGYASAMAYTLFVLLFVVSFLQFRWYLKRVER